MAFPKRNLPQEATPWGREIENTATQLSRSVSFQDQSFNNFSRSFSGQLSVLSGQIDELYNRRIDTVPIPQFSVTGSGTGEPFPRATQTVNIPGGSATRSCLIGVSYDLNESGSGSGNSVIYSEISVNGEILARVNPGLTSATPISGWPGQTANALIPASVPSSGARVDITLIRVAFTSATTTWTASSGLISIYYGDRIE